MPTNWHRVAIATMILLYCDDIVYTDTSEPTSDSTGILFNKVKTVILAEKFEPAKFLLPFPRFDQQLTLNLENAPNIIAEYWNAYPGNCPELQSRTVPDHQASQMVSAAHEAHAQALTDLQHMKEEIASLLLPPDRVSRAKRFVIAAALAAGAITAGIMTIGAQIATGCVAGVLGPCETEKQVAENTDLLNTALQRLHDNEMQWTRVTEEVNEKFYLVASELKDIRQTQKEIYDQQMPFWNATAETLNGLTSSVKTMTLCTEYLFTRSQINLLRTTVTARLQTILSAIQSFRVALWAYRATLLDAIPNMAKGYIPMSLIPRDTLLQILEEIHREQGRDTEHRTLALTLDNLLRYYETPLIRRVESSEDGLLITIAIPLTTRSMVMDVYEGIPLPMPTGDNATATMWKPTARYIAVSHEHKENALLTAEQLAECIGPDDAAVCRRGFATTSNWNSCLATLFYHVAEAAVTTCDITTITLPRAEEARSLGYGRWLILCQTDDYTLRLLPAGLGTSTTYGSTRHIPGCRACIITLECGMILESDNLFLKADATSCNATGARRLEITLNAPLANLFSYIPLTEDLPDLSVITARRAHLFKEVQAHLPLPQFALSTPSDETLQAIAEPIATQIVGPLLQTSYGGGRGSWWIQILLAAILAAIFNAAAREGYDRIRDWQHAQEKKDEPIPLQPFSHLHQAAVTTSSMQLHHRSSSSYPHQTDWPSSALQ